MANQESTQEPSSQTSQSNTGDATKGFAAMDPKDQREIAAEGGRVSHENQSFSRQALDKNSQPESTPDSQSRSGQPEGTSGSQSKSGQTGRSESKSGSEQRQ